MKTPKYFFHTDDVLKDRLITKIARREDLISKLASYDKEIEELETELSTRAEKSKGLKQG